MILPRFDPLRPPAVAFDAAIPPRRAAPALFALVHEGGPVELPFLGADVCLAADRPDRLEAAFLAGPARRFSPLGPPEGAAKGWPSLRPGARLRAFLAGVQVFEGLADRVVRRAGGQGGLTLEVVAYARYHSLRTARPADIYYQLTDAEIAARIAGDLELAAVTDPTERVHRRIARREDPLRFLRRLSREAGFGLAVAAGKLYFRRDVAARGGSYLVTGKALVSCAEIASGERQGRHGSLVIAGDPRLRPLARVRLVDGEECVAERVIHRVSVTGFTTHADLAPRGAERGEEAAP